jgi:hypothetical protein
MTSAARADRRLSADGARLDAVVADISRPEECAHMAGEVTDTRGGIDVLCADAGMFVGTPSADMTEAEYDEAFDLTMEGCLFSAQASSAWCVRPPRSRPPRASRTTAAELDHVPVGVEYVVPGQSVNAERTVGDDPSLRPDRLQGHSQGGDVEDRLEGRAVTRFRWDGYHDGFGDSHRDRVDQHLLPFIDQSDVTRPFVGRPHIQDGPVEVGQATDIDREHDE